jgi:acetyltransferase-like isoleucine patch superfamily enzyme
VGFPRASQLLELGPVEVARIVRARMRARLDLRGTRRGSRIRCYGPVLVPHPAGVEVGEQSLFMGGMIPTELRCHDGAELVIGPRSIFNYGVSVVAHESVRIGADCLFASLVHIRDHDGRRTDPVTIGVGVWIAYGAVIEPGSTIGDYAVVGAMAVVSGMVPARSLALGNPAKHSPLKAQGGGELPT